MTGFNCGRGEFRCPGREKCIQKANLCKKETTGCLNGPEKAGYCGKFAFVGHIFGGFEQHNRNYIRQDWDLSPVGNVTP